MKKSRYKGARAAWCFVHRQNRIIARELADACTDSLVYGKGMISIDANANVKRIPIQKLGQMITEAEEASELRMAALKQNIEASIMKYAADDGVVFAPVRLVSGEELKKMYPLRRT